MTSQIESVDSFGNPIIPVLVNECYGGFGLSKVAETAVQTLFDRKDKGPYDEFTLKRHDEDLISAVVTIGLDDSSNKYSRLCIKYIPAEFIDSYYIDEYDGFEGVKLDYKKYLMTQLDLIMENVELTSDQKIEEVNKVRFYVKEIERNCHYY